MKWYGILALIVLLGALAGVVYLGMNTEKFYESKGNSIDLKMLKIYAKNIDNMTPLQNLTFNIH